MAAALAGCSGESGGIEDSGDNTPNNPIVKNPAGCTVSYQTGNGKGISPKSEPTTKNTPIELPDNTGLEAPQEGAVFVGWNDGTLTYPPEYIYTVTKNVTFKARWAFTTPAEITACLAANSAPVVIAVADAEPPVESGITWENLLSAIGDAKKAVELDLSESTLALFPGNSASEKKFDYKNGQNDACNTGEKYIKKLVLPSAATSIDPTKVFKDGPFLSLEAVSGLNVSDIADRAFSNISTLTAIIFPSAVRIGDSAFENCSLTSVSLPAAKTIISFAFRYCTSLTSVSLPEATSINYAAFSGCSSLTEMSLPKAETINYAAFSACVNLTELSLPAVESIGDYAFSNCVNLTELSLPAETIGNFAFINCIKLTEVSLPKAKTIGTSAFQYCGSLTEVSLPVAAGTIGASAFSGCAKLTVITIAGNCNITDNTTRGGFQTYYTTTKEKAAGVYTYSSDSSGISSWSYAPPAGTP